MSLQPVKPCRSAAERYQGVIDEVGTLRVNIGMPVASK